ncbi:MAG TPA: T9SS type A sorting domain-containing protein [Puia sp.]|nr:T9SS type A sorting domain-containing protein [Puia sp.]
MKTKLCSVRTVKALLALVIFFLVSNLAYAQPTNDLCSGASTLTSGTTCTTTAGTLKNATASVGIAVNCGAATSADVWYSFVATSSYPTITLSSLGGSLSAAGARIQLFSGTCASMTSLACVSGNTLNVLTNIGGAGLTVGTTYYIRIYTNSTGPFTTGLWGFNICITNLTTGVPTVDYGKSYLNITKGTTGGTIEPGDTLEIRATIVVKANSAYDCSFTDNIPANTTYQAGTLRVLTNEGKIYQQFTDASDADGGTLSGSAITINLGSGATATAGGILANTSKPSFYGGSCIMIASYRVVVGAVGYNTVVSVGAGMLQYNNTTGMVQVTFPKDDIMLFKNYGMCPNTVGSNAIINEFGGTFGSGSTKDRAASNKVPSNYTYSAFSSSAGMPNDYYYGISNNTSGGTTAAQGYSILNTWAKPDNSQSPSHRIFGVWDIIGDHTGAASPTAGNPATDDNSGKTGGYMVVVNSAYRTDTAFLDTVYNLCPNTYYQYSGWFRNMCSRCGCDSNGVGSGSSGYIPTNSTTHDSSGVYPNLTFNVNGYDYYTTGNIQYSGQWVQKGFTFLTGATQTTMVISIRNNAPGGGGNDWAIDDIGVASCSPQMVLTPNKPDTLCQGADDTVRFKVISYFSNYTEWKMEKSTDGGTTWVTVGVDTTGAAASGSAVPVYNSATGQYEYIITRYFRLNAVNTYLMYRITVASTTANLSSSSCSFITLSPKIVLAVNCMIVLPTTLISFRGQVREGLSALQWVSADETADVGYIVERSDDGVNFTSIGFVKGTAGAGQGAGYHYTDPNPPAAQSYYRINITSDNTHRYSSLVLLGTAGIGFEIRSVVNPFSDHITMELTTPGDGTVVIRLTDMYGRVVRREKAPVSQGLNGLSLYGLGGLTNGTYVLQIQYADKMISEKMVKFSK